MKIRAELTFNGEDRRPYLVAGPNEPDEHVAHRLAAYILFWGFDPLLDASVKTPALAGYEFLPDLLGVDAGGEPTLWVECGSVTMHKLTKVTRRMPRARLVVIKETEREAARLRQDLAGQFDRPEKVEILAWPGTSYKDWLALIGARVEAFGESDGRMINGVVNETPVVIEFRSF